MRLLKMSYSWRIVVISLCVWGGVRVSAWAVEDANFPQRDRVLRILKESVQKNRGDSAAAIQAMIHDIQEVQTLIPADHYSLLMLKSLLTRADRAEEAALQAKMLASGIENVHESLTFKPISEAKLPVDYPAPTPVHWIEVKKLPVYRLAKVEMSASGKTGEGRSFWALFNHIKRNDIAMTAPVEIEYDENKENSREKSMAFLYRSTELGTTGVDPADTNVQISDAPETWVVSIGCRGKMSDESVEQAAEKLQVWLADHADQYRQAGPLRKLGYNSPMVPSFMSYFEVQIPVEPVN